MYFRIGYCRSLFGLAVLCYVLFLPFIYTFPLTSKGSASPIAKRKTSFINEGLLLTKSLLTTFLQSPNNTFGAKETTAETVPPSNGYVLWATVGTFAPKRPAHRLTEVQDHCHRNRYRRRALSAWILCRSVAGTSGRTSNFLQ